MRNPPRRSHSPDRHFDGTFNLANDRQAHGDCLGTRKSTDGIQCELDCGWKNWTSYR
jgi:hypothetical protein